MALIREQNPWMVGGGIGQGLSGLVQALMGNPREKVQAEMLRQQIAELPLRRQMLQNQVDEGPLNLDLLRARIDTEKQQGVASAAMAGERNATAAHTTQKTGLVADLDRFMVDFLRALEQERTGMPAVASGIVPHIGGKMAALQEGGKDLPGSIAGLQALAGKGGEMTNNERMTLLTGSSWLPKVVSEGGTMFDPSGNLLARGGVDLSPGHQYIPSTGEDFDVASQLFNPTTPAPRQSARDQFEIAAFKAEVEQAQFEGKNHLVPGIVEKYRKRLSSGVPSTAATGKTITSGSGVTSGGNRYVIEPEAAPTTTSTNAPPPASVVPLPPPQTSVAPATLPSAPQTIPSIVERLMAARKRGDTQMTDYWNNIANPGTINTLPEVLLEGVTQPGKTFNWSDSVKQWAMNNLQPGFAEWFFGLSPTARAEFLARMQQSPQAYAGLPSN